MCVCTLSSWIQHSILFSQIWELQNFIFLGSRSWQKCTCDIPDGENVHADSMYPWGSFHCAALFCPATAVVCLDKTRSWRHGSGCGILADLHYRAPTRQCACVREHSDVAQSLPSLIVMTFRRLSSRRWLQSSETFACPAWNEYLSCSANSKSSSTLAQGVTLVRKPRSTASVTMLDVKRCKSSKLKA